MPPRWFDRTFDLGLPASAAPAIVARLRTAPARLEAAVANLPPAVLTRQPDGHWSIQEHAGHLGDLEPLWEQRLHDFDAGARVLHPADLENRRTHEANHNGRLLSEVLRDFRVARQRIVARLAAMTDAELSRVSLHPRLQQPMSVVDLCFFVAEHDDHHLQVIAELSAR